MDSSTSAVDGAAVERALIEAGTPYAGVEVRGSVPSTNALAAERPPWTAVVADEQTAGRGRLGRSWSTPPGRALAVSVLVEPTATPSWLPLLAGLAVREAAREVAGVGTLLKWPNDVLVPADGDRKLCGILCELVPAGVVVGVGVNVSQTRAELPVGTATSLALAGADGVDRERLLTAYLQHLARLHQVLAGDGPGRLRTAYEEASATIGTDVEVHLPAGEVLGGRATGIDAHGRLVLTTAAGERSVAAGDVVHVRRGP